LADLKTTRKRLYDDFKFYAAASIKIRTEDGQVKPLVLNSPQTKLHNAIEAQRTTTGQVRIIILKARQQGFSTYVHGRLYWKLSQRRARKGMVVAHVADSSRALWDMYKRTHNSTPELLKPSTSYNSGRILTFDKLDTGLMVATAGSDTVARGETLTDVHLSEVAFWPKISAADNLSGLLKAVPDTKDTDVYIESTANGMTGPFFDMWKGAVAGTNGFIPFFSPWFDSHKYRREVPAHFERTFEEMDLVEQYGLDDEQLMFRRIEIAKHGTEQFWQEYPSNADEAFIASGRPVFNPEQIHKMLQAAKSPISRMLHAGQSFIENSRGELRIWHELDVKEEYYIGADVAMGIRDGDYSVAQVLDSQKRLVASWHGHVHPDYFSEVLYALGMYFNEARIIVENNNHGILTAVRLGRDLAYPNCYTEISEGQLNDRETITIGFRTTEKSKPLVIDRLRASMRELEMEIEDEGTLKEMLSYIVTETGRMQAEEGNHDDRVMALALANHIHIGRFTPILVDDSFYVEAI
jgi:hypothetical protein